MAWASEPRPRDSSLCHTAMPAPSAQPQVSSALSLCHAVRWRTLRVLQAAVGEEDQHARGVALRARVAQQLPRAAQRQRNVRAAIHAALPGVHSAMLGSQHTVFKSFMPLRPLQSMCLSAHLRKGIV